MRIGVTGHTSGLGKMLFERYEARGFSRSNGYDITKDDDRKRIIEDAQGLDAFINCAHSSSFQVALLYELTESFNGRIISISSNSGDGIKSQSHPYAAYKVALDKASEQLFYTTGKYITCLRPGYFESERTRGIHEPALSLETIVEVIDYCLTREFRIKELTFSV